MNQDKKKAAAVAAVIQYIKTSEEAAAAAHMAAAPQQDAQAYNQAPPATAQNTWGTVGRQTQMQMRNLMQLKAFHGPR